MSRSSKKKAKTDRVLIALDANLRSLDALRLAAELAAHLEAELLALFVEDVNLIRLAGLPFAREVDRSSAVERQLDSLQMTRALKLRTQQARRVLTEVCGELRLRSSLRVVRGHYVAEALSAAGDMDVLFLGGSKAAVQRHALGRGESATGHAPVWILYDGTVAAGRALVVAADLARPAARELVVLLSVETAAGGEPLQAQAAALLGEFAQRVRYTVVPTADIVHILDTLRDGGWSLVVLHRDEARDPDIAIKALIEQVDCPVVLVS